MNPRSGIGVRSTATATPSATGALSAPTPEAAFGRRAMLRGLLAAGTVGAVGGIPALADALAVAPRLGRNDRVVVVVTLDGGNDWLNTVVPMGDGRYRDLRGNLAITQGLLPIGDGLGLHPNLRWLKGQHDKGRLATVLGIGETTRDHSHFSCMARWMGGRAGVPPYTDGWLGRTLDARGDDTIAGIAVGNQGVPLVLQRSHGDAIGLPVIGDLFGADRRFPASSGGGLKPVVHAHRALRGFARSGLSEVSDRLMTLQADAIDVSVDVNPTFTPSWPSSWPQFVADMELAARVVNLDVGVRMVHVEFTGFDTHSSQRPTHDDLLADLDRGLKQFASTLRSGFDDRVVTLVVSEFGRRGARNGSNATDHGAGGAAFVLGGPVTGGLYGEQPSLRRLDSRGDLDIVVDHRALYATVLDRYLRVDAEEILGATYERLRIFDPAAFCQGQLATHVGTGGRDVIVGTGRGDVIVGGAGNDVIRAKDGDDLVCAGGGNDRVFGGGGHDVLRGEAGRDQLTGNKGRDTLIGGGGRDRLRRDRRDRAVRQ